MEVRGVKHLNELKVYESVLSQRNRAMPLVDLQAVRAQLLALSWVADARVSRQLPDALVVDIVERSPHAVLRVHEDGGDRLVLIDSEGHALEPISAARVHGRLVLSGEGRGGAGGGAFDTARRRPGAAPAGGRSAMDRQSPLEPDLPHRPDPRPARRRP